MTMRKFKKLLMSYGVERNLAEAEARSKGVLRRLMGDPNLTTDWLDPVRSASVLMEVWGGKLNNVRNRRVVN